MLLDLLLLFSPSFKERLVYILKKSRNSWSLAYSYFLGLMLMSTSSLLITFSLKMSSFSSVSEKKARFRVISLKLPTSILKLPLELSTLRESTSPLVSIELLNPVRLGYSSIVFVRICFSSSLCCLLLSFSRFSRKICAFWRLSPAPEKISRVILVVPTRWMFSSPRKSEMPW